MQIGTLPRPRCRGRSLSPPPLSPPARPRLPALEVWPRTGAWRLAAQVFGLARATLVRWRRR